MAARPPGRLDKLTPQVFKEWLDSLTTTSSVDFSYTKLGDELDEGRLKTLRESFALCRRLTFVDLSNTNLGVWHEDRIDADRIIESLTQCPNLLFLNVSRNQLNRMNEPRIKGFVESLGRCLNLSSVNLSNNDLGMLDLGRLKILIEGLAQNPHLSSLILGVSTFNEFSDRWFNTFMDALETNEKIIIRFPKEDRDLTRLTPERQIRLQRFTQRNLNFTLTRLDNALRVSEIFNSVEKGFKSSTVPYSDITLLSIISSYVNEEDIKTWQEVCKFIGGMVDANNAPQLREMIKKTGGLEGVKNTIPAADQRAVDFTRFNGLFVDNPPGVFKKPTTVVFSGSAPPSGGEPAAPSAPTGSGAAVPPPGSEAAVSPEIAKPRHPSR